MAAVYKLFDSHDQQLLKQASRIANEAEIIFYTALGRIFAPDVANATELSIPDRQTLMLSNKIKSLIRVEKAPQHIKILDLGAGVGRVVKEMSKLTSWQLGTRIQWICWEPNPVRRNELKVKLQEVDSKVEVPETLGDVSNGSCQLIVIANVLHEVTPDQFATLVSTAREKVAMNYGELIIMELYPLLHAEKYAVPYPADRLAWIFNSTGFISSTDYFPVRDVVGYCICARPTEMASRSKSEYVTHIESVWRELEKQICYSYAHRRGINSYEDYRSVIQDLTTLSSIAAWRNGLWKRDLAEFS